MEYRQIKKAERDRENTMEKNIFAMQEENKSDKLSKLIRDFANCPECRTCKRQDKTSFGCRRELKEEVLAELKQRKGEQK